MKLENTQVQMRKGILEFCILEIIARGEAYASDMLEELTSARMIVVEGTLYPLLTRLKNAALLDYDRALRYAPGDAAIQKEKANVLSARKQRSDKMKAVYSKAFGGKSA